MSRAAHVIIVRTLFNWIARDSLFGATQDQLGLKLEGRLEMMDVLVIDSAEMPSEN